jgi:hypothetical protein
LTGVATVSPRDAAAFGANPVSKPGLSNAVESGNVNMPERLQLSTDPGQIREAFSIWRRAMEQHARRRGSIWWLPEGKVYFQTNGSEFKLGSDPLGENWIVQLNEPGQGTENPLSGIARNSTGRPFLLRQGILHKNAQSPRIESNEFADRTGLKPANVTRNGKPARRAWFIVTALDIPEDEICQNTAAFVERCSLARDRDVAAMAKLDDERLNDLFGKPEQGGQVTGQPTINPNQLRRIQGEVWQKLYALLVADGRGLHKPKHARGYEVDGEIETPTGRLLLEIKTNNTAADVYTGIGQLIVYPKLLPRLSGHRRILLLPGAPSGVLIEAIRECGVELHSYNLKLDGGEVHVSFSARFLQLCNLDAERDLRVTSR